MTSLDVWHSQRATTAFKYATVGNSGSFDSLDGTLKYGQKPQANIWGWDSVAKTGVNGSGEIKKRNYYSRYHLDYNGAVTGEVFSNAVYSGGEWTMDLTLDGVSTYTMKFTDAYNATNYPGEGGDDSSGLPFVWYDDYYLYNDLGYDDDLACYGGVAPTAYGNAGRWVLVRDELSYKQATTNTDFGKTHGGDVCAARNIQGETVEGYFEHAWKIAGTMLGQKFWDDDPDYYWSGLEGKVAESTFTTDASLTRLTNGYTVEMPVYEWDGGAWVLPDAAIDILTTNTIWGLPDHDVESTVAGYDKLNNFLRYVMDIDALVVEDKDADGTFDAGDDYILFSLTDDGTWSKFKDWGTSDLFGINTSFDGEYYDGNTVFLYDGTSVTTWFAPHNAVSGTAIFFGEEVSTTVATLMAGAFDFDLDTLDIGGVIPEPSTILLMLGSASGLAFAAGTLRKRVR